MMHLMLFAALACVVPSSQALTGLWESAQTSKGGIGNSIELRADGTFVEGATVQVNGYYRVEGNRMFLTERAEDRSTKESRPFRMDGSSLLIEGPGGQTLRMDRVGGSSETTVLGAWRYKHYTGQIAFERFLPDGRMNFRLPMMSSSACYTMDAAGTSITLQGSKAVVMKFERKGEGDTLRLQSPGRSDASYVREPAGMWYEWPSR